MKYSIEYINDKKIVHIKLEGRLSFQFAEQFSKEALKLARQNQCNKFVFDHSDTELKNKSINLHVAGEELQQFGFKDSDWIAIIVTKPVLKFLAHSTLSVNSRWSVIEYFSKGKSENAYQWLMDQQ